MMKKRWLLCGFLAALCVALCGLTLAEGAPEAVGCDEILALADSLRTRALAEDLLNDPASEEAQTEDGTLFLTPSATLYAEGGALTEDSVIRAAVISEEEVPALRGSGIDLHTEDLIALFRCDNPTLDGTREGALIYYEEAEGGEIRWASLERDGQRVSAVRYGVLMPGAEGRHPLCVTYFIEHGLVSRIRIDGLADTLDEESSGELIAGLLALKEASGYTQVPSSGDGLSLTAFGPEDLLIGGVDYLTARPEDLPGTPEDILLDNEDGTWLRILNGDGYEAVFSCGPDGSGAVLISYTLTDEALEGPRGVRLGDLFHEDFRRFRSGENETDGTTELLYGTDGTAPYAAADYVDGTGMTLRYVTDTPDGRTVMLRLHYENNALTELMLQTV